MLSATGSAPFLTSHIASSPSLSPLAKIFGSFVWYSKQTSDLCGLITNNGLLGFSTKRRIKNNTIYTWKFNKPMSHMYELYISLGILA